MEYRYRQENWHWLYAAGRRQPAPGPIIAFICGQIGTGFIGGSLVGYTVLLLRRTIKLPASMQS